MLRENDIISKVLLTIDQYKGSLNQFKNAIVDNEYSSLNCKHFSKTLVWKVCLIADSLNIQTWDTKLSNARVVYHQLVKRDDMAIPWWGLEKDSVFYQDKDQCRKPNIRKRASIRRSGTLKKNVLPRISNVDDPLRSPSISPTSTPSEGYTSTGEDLELLEAIILDIDRLFPGEDFFHSSNPSSLASKKQLIEVLYVWSKCNPQVGYKQGIHEILGLIYINLYKESIPIPSTNTISTDDLRILSLYDFHYLCHDLFTLFNKFMVQSGVIANFYESESILWKSIENFNINLMKIDQLIHYNLINKLKLESQLWIIRYLRLLLLRELGSDLDTISLLWDKLIAIRLTNHTGNSITAIPDIIIFMIIVLLIQIKTDLITCDFSESLSLLLHYPIASKFSNESKSEFISNLFRDAVKLYERKDNDLKLYEYGITLNKKFSPNLKITMSYNGSARNSNESSISNSPSPSVASSSSRSVESKAEKMKFEKLRLEMRLKKKAQSLMRS